MKRFFSHFEARVEASASGNWREGHHHCDGVFRSRDGIAEGGIHHDDPLLGGSGDIDIVDADAGAPNDLKIACSGDDLLGHLGSRADGQAIILADHFKELVLVFSKIGKVVDVNAVVFEDLDGSWAEFVGNENLGHGALLVFAGPVRACEWNSG
jgi:hypothetical protein